MGMKGYTSRDIVLVAENLNMLSIWCKLNGMVVNGTKSNIVNFRTPTAQSQFVLLVI